MDGSYIGLYLGIGWILFLASLKAYDLYKKYRDDEEERKDSQEKAQKWLKSIEPLHRNTPTYPEDWNQRKVYIQKRDRYTCQICKRSVFSNSQIDKNLTHRFHASGASLDIHHKIPLSKGGTNQLSNLVSLCRYCHENQHLHMLTAKKRFYAKKLKLARSAASIRKWQLDVEYIEARIDGFRPHKWQ